MNERFSENVSAYTFFPDGDPRQDFNAVRVERTYWEGGGGFYPHPNGEWAIRWLGRCYNREGEWEYEPLPSSRDEEFFVRCRFTLREALAAAPLLADQLPKPNQPQPKQTPSQSSTSSRGCR